MNVEKAIKILRLRGNGSSIAEIAHDTALSKRYVEELLNGSKWPTAWAHTVSEIVRVGVKGEEAR